ncbi:MAG TPA: hypothetical protein VMB47_06820 [Candidatus Aquilonibacter sp.]|nr:hypothetical protein [Candidatus Aquilonibacter sp.]
MARRLVDSQSALRTATRRRAERIATAVGGTNGAYVLRNESGLPAAENVFANALKGIELEDIDARLAELERTPDGGAAMKTIQRRLRRIEDRFLQGRPSGLRIVVTGVTRRPIPDNDTCVKILEECGYLRDTGGISMVRLIDIPDGLDAKETERFLRERGAELCT